MNESNDTTFKSIGQIIINIPTPTHAVEGEKRPRIERNDVLNELYDLYTSQPEETRKENRLRYRFWMSKHYPQHCKKAGFDLALYNSHKDEFRKTAEARGKNKLPPEQQYIPYYKKDDFRWWGRFSHLKGPSGLSALRHMVSVARDKKHRGESVAKYILGSVKAQDEQHNV